MPTIQTPPLRWWVPLAGFAALGAALVMVVLQLVPSPGPLDDPDPAEQRDGIVRNGPELPPTLGGLRFGGQVMVLLFDRTLPSGPDFQRWSDEVAHGGALPVVCVAGVKGCADLATAVGLATPTDGGAPVGYAVVDQGRRVRYVTLDPAYLQNSFEVNVITQAIKRSRR